MLGIANPNNLVSVDELRKKSTNLRGKDKDTHYTDCRFYGHVTTRKEIAQLLVNFVIVVGGKTTSNLNAKLSQSHDSRKPSKANGRCTHKCRVNEINECQNDMEDMSEQVQSLVYS